MNSLTDFLAALPPAAPLAVFTTGTMTAAGSGSGAANFVEFSAAPEEWEMLLSRADRPVILFDLKSVLRERGIPANLSRRLFDVKLATYLENPAYNTENPAACAEAVLRTAELAVTPQDNCRILLKLYEVLAPRWDVSPLFRDIEMPLSAVLAQMEQSGIRLDDNALRKFGMALKIRLAELEKIVYAAAGSEFNLNSPKQLSTLLFETLKLPPPGKKTKSGYSTDAEALAKLRNAHPMIAPLLEYRTLAKLNSTYVEGLLKAQKADGRLHTTFQMTATATGRLSSTDPNLQNIPVRTELGGELRKMLVAEPGELLLDADYSQIELRILAHIAADPVMCEAFRNNEDIHTVTASQVFEIAPDAVTPELRRRAKAVNFGIVYGISAFALAADLGIERAEAQRYIDNYFAKYSGVKAYLDNVVGHAKKNGYVETLFGRRRYLPELKSPVFAVRSFGERVALNMPIQGTAADLIKVAMIRVSRELQAAGLQSRLILQIHDELVVAAPEAEQFKAAKLLQGAMEGALALRVPLAVSLSGGYNYLDLKSL